MTTFLTDVKHLPIERELWWCPRESLFASPTHGEAFGRDGHAIGGPAFAGLDRLETRVLDGVVEIDPHAVLAEGTPNEQTFQPPDGAWDAGSGSFCSDAVVSGDRVDVESLATLHYSAREYVVPAGVVDIHFRSLGGTHTLVLEDNEAGDFVLQDPGGPMARAVELDPGTYTIFCHIPGHRAAGMEATIVVTP